MFIYARLADLAFFGTPDRYSTLYSMQLYIYSCTKCLEVVLIIQPLMQLHAMSTVHHRCLYTHCELHTITVL
jgi:hypothetical protein